MARSLDSPAPHVDGRVVELAHHPIAGATVRTSDGRLGRAVSAAGTYRRAAERSMSDAPDEVRGVAHGPLSGRAWPRG